MVRAYCAAEYIVTTIRCIPYAQTQIDRGVYIESPPGCMLMYKLVTVNWDGNKIRPPAHAAAAAAAAAGVSVTVKHHHLRRQ